VIDNIDVDASANTFTDQSNLLSVAENAPPGAAVEAVARQLSTLVGATQVVFLIADLSGQCLVPLTHISASAADGRVDSVSIHDTHEGIALRRQKTQIINDGGHCTLHVPVTSRGDAIGVLVMELPRSATREIIEQAEAASHMLAYILIANRRLTDLYEWGQRSGPMTLAAEIQRRIIPDAFSCEAGWFTVAGWLEPSVDVAGDTFDYSFDQKRLALSLTDAMGHSVESALLATVAVAALRNTRRTNKDIAAQANAVNAALSDHAGGDQFVSGLLVNIPLEGNDATIINAGHPPPFLVRGGSASIISVTADVPFGMFPDTNYEVQDLSLHLGDRLVLVTDGLLERNASDFDLRRTIESLAHLHPREFVRELCGQVTEAAGGKLADDATVLCFDWHDEPGSPRNSKSGSDETGASD
jgi:serine phosphatase RsbU (regulator of sigma subunit)